VTSERRAVLLLSTYDLGHRSQLGALLRGALGAALSVRACDSEGDELQRAIEDAAAVIVHAPMLTGALLARDVLEEHRRSLAARRVILVGSYASTLALSLGTQAPPNLAVIDREDPVLVRAAIDGTPPPPRGGRRLYDGRRATARPITNDRHLEHAGTIATTGYVETTIGCRHRCRHCPIAGAWNGRLVTLDVASILEDINEQVAKGAAHISFGDADFLSAPRHALGVLEEAHARHPGVSFDVTIKISELAAEPKLALRLQELGVLFVISAVETLRDDILERLGKGHCRSDVYAVRDALFEAGVGMHPTFIPFTPWSRLEDVVDILAFVWSSHLEDVVEPVQYGIELLVPATSLLQPDPAFGGFDPRALGHTWDYEDSRLKGLARQIRAAAARACSYAVGFQAVWELLGGGSLPDRGPRRAPEAARMSEAWFCCAAPPR